MSRESSLDEAIIKAKERGSYTEKLLEAYLSERKQMMDNAKLKIAFNETLARLIAANEETETNYMDEDYCDLLRELGIEVGEWATQTAQS